MNFFKSNLKYLLKRLRVSQEHLASHVNVRSTTISNYVNGISSPAIQELTSICQFFGISVDDLLFQNFEDGKLITDEDVANFKSKGKLTAGKQSKQKLNLYQGDNPALNVLNESEENMFWAVLQTLRSIDAKLDGLQASVEKIKAKK